MGAWLAIALVVTAQASGFAQARQEEIPGLIRTVARGSRPEVDRAIDRLQFLGLTRGATGAIIQLARSDDAVARGNAAYALSVLHPPASGPTLAWLLGDPDSSVRFAACQGLGRLKPVRGAGATMGARLRDESPAVRRACAGALGAWGDRARARALAAALDRERDPDARLAEIEALGLAGANASAAALDPWLKDASEQVRYAAARSLAQLGAPGGRAYFESAADSPDPFARKDALEVASAVKARWVTALLAKKLDDAHPLVCIAAAKGLATRDDPRGVRTLVVRAEYAKPDEKFAYETALLELKVTQAQRLAILRQYGVVR